VKSEPNSSVKPGDDIKALRDAGMPMAKNPYVRGAIYVVFSSEKQLTDSAKKVIKQVLPQPSDEAVAAVAVAQATVAAHGGSDAHLGSKLLADQRTLLAPEATSTPLRAQQLRPHKAGKGAVTAADAASTLDALLPSLSTPATSSSC
jgi:hypothetical protein